MSTPSAAAPVLHYHSNPYFSHHQGYQANTSLSYHSTSNPSLLPSLASLAASLGSHNSQGLHSASISRSSRQPETVASYARAGEISTWSDFQSRHQAPSLVTSIDRFRKRQRLQARGPNWNEFYKNGLPKEVIVIDDSPQPEPRTPNITTHTGFDETVISKKRKLAEDRVPYDPIYDPVNQFRSRINSPLHTSYSSSTLSADRTATGTGVTPPSLSSGHDEPQLHDPRKRLRLNTFSVAAESGRSDAIPLQPETSYTYRPLSFPPRRAGDVLVRVIEDARREKKSEFDDEDGHYTALPESDLTSRYQIVKTLGQGTFGKVVQARDKKKNKFVAVKIIRSVQKYRDASRIELRVLQTLKYNDSDNRNRCIHLRDCFDYRGHICIVMDLLGQSVFDFLKGNCYVPFPNSQIQNFAKQLFTSVAYLHDINLIHTDLKPENILICDDSYQTFTYNRRVPSCSNNLSRHAAQRKVLLSTEIRLIDFGSATFHDEYHSTVVSTRHYRAPEIILGLGWTYPCDIWSIGCILVELFTGDALFQTHDNLEHLAMMEAVCGYRIDPALVVVAKQIAARSQDKEDSVAQYFKKLRLDYPVRKTSRHSRRFVKSMRTLDEMIPATSNFLENFLDLLKKIFVYDPQKRITAVEALAHPWLHEQCPFDDGTEAARIRYGRVRLERNNPAPPI